MPENEAGAAPRQPHISITRWREAAQYVYPRLRRERRERREDYHAHAAALLGQDTAPGECSISRHGVERLENLDFRIWLWPLRHGGENFHVALLSDIRAEKRLDLMERIFYHDILNLVSGMHGVCELMREDDEGTRNAELDLLLFAVERVTDLILSQRDLSFAERGLL